MTKYGDIALAHHVSAKPRSLATRPHSRNPIGARRPRRKRPVLPLTAGERAAFRRAGVRIADVSTLSVEELAATARLPLSRCRSLSALATFQTLGSVGPSIAGDLVDLGYHSIEALAKGEPARMYAALSRKVGHHVDPCVEDVFRCAVAQARDPSLPAEARNWWYWLPYRGQPLESRKARGSKKR